MKQPKIWKYIWYIKDLLAWQVVGLASYDGSFVWAAETMRSPANLSQPNPSRNVGEKSWKEMKRKFKEWRNRNQPVGNGFILRNFHIFFSSGSFSREANIPWKLEIVGGTWMWGVGYAHSMQMAALDICFRWITSTPFSFPLYDCSLTVFLWQNITKTKSTSWLCCFVCLLAHYLPLPSP